MKVILVHSRDDEERKQCSSSSSLSLGNVQILNKDVAQLDKNVLLCCFMLFLKSVVDFKNEYIASDYLG